MVWCVSPEPVGLEPTWEIAVCSVRIGLGVIAETVYQPKDTPDDEDGRPSGWLSATGRLTINADGTATITSL